MKPGHGDVLLAEGDLELAEDEERLVEEFRRQLDAGHVGGGAARGAQRPPRGDDGARLRRDPARRRAGHLLPARRPADRARLAPTDAGDCAELQRARADCCGVGRARRGGDLRDVPRASASSASSAAATAAATAT